LTANHASRHNADCLTVCLSGGQVRGRQGRMCHLMSENKRFDRGLEIRREVLGSAHVDKSLANATDFGRPLQELVTEYCWGSVWSREGLDRRTRSLLNIVMLTALDQQAELQLHVRGALINGCTEAEIQECLLQAAIYCGVPAALAASRSAEAAIAAYKESVASADALAPIE
jgi:4-carboxymuconolactone decarboxylase